MATQVKNLDLLKHEQLWVLSNLERAIIRQALEYLIDNGNRGPAVTKLANRTREALT